jgi:signal peptidase II
MPEQTMTASTARSISWWAWLPISAGVIGLDQLTKWLIQQILAFGQSIRVLPFFNLVLVYNPGAAFSFLSSAAGWQRHLFVAIALAASVLIVYLLRKYAHDRMFCFALSLILGGAIGNLIDRLLLGAVVDFLDVHAFGYHWPAFNLADSAITLGAGLLIWDSLRRPRQPLTKA